MASDGPSYSIGLLQIKYRQALNSVLILFDRFMQIFCLKSIIIGKCGILVVEKGFSYRVGQPGSTGYETEYQL